MSDVMHRVFIGDTHNDLAVTVQQYDPSAYLLDLNTYQRFLAADKSLSQTGYTSLGDLSGNLQILYDVFLRSDEIIYVPPPAWSDGKNIDLLDPTSSIKGQTEHLLLRISDLRPVKNIEKCFHLPDVLPLVDHRRTTNPQLWAAGCSITHGTAIDPGERYGQLVAEHLGTEVSFLTRPGSSIPWTANQLLRSDLRNGDIVIWGVTSSERSFTVHQGKYYSATVNSRESGSIGRQLIPMETLLGEKTFYENIYAIESVINFCSKCGAKLLLFGLLTSINMFPYLKSKHNYTHFEHSLGFSNDSITYIDLGTDQQHPGPKQHEIYADHCIKNLQNLGYITA